jgi:hypothetical protein
VLFYFTATVVENKERSEKEKTLQKRLTNGERFLDEWSWYKETKTVDI